MKQMVRALLDRLPQEALITDSAGKVVWMNRYAREQEVCVSWLGRRLDEVLSLAEMKTGTTMVQTADGVRYDVEREPWEDGAIWILEDLTSFRNPKIQLQCCREIIDKLDVFATDVKGRFVIASKAAANYYGMDQKELMDHHLSDFYQYPTEEEKEHQRVIQSGTPILNQYSDRPATGRNFVYRPLLYSTYPFAYHGKNILAYTIIQDDKKAEALLQEITELRRRMHARDLQDEANKRRNNTSYSFLDVVGSSRQTRENIQDAQLMSNLDQNILIIGETGTGKEIFAQSIHNFSRRKQSPFIPINCAAIPENLLESMLFGTTKGAYTGAVESEGLFQRAGHGTVFLDELNSMPVQMQTKLLRVLQERKAMRVGGSTLYPVHCRVISAVNQDPHTLIQSGLLRSDLFYRIAPLTLHIAPLRERPEDILDLSVYFIQKYNKIFHKAVRGISREVESLLLSAPWPGNVRELEYVVENMMIRSQAALLRREDLPRHLEEQLLAEARACVGGERAAREPDLPAAPPREEEIPRLEEALAQREEELILRALHSENGNRKRAAERLGVSRQNLYYRLKRLNGKNLIQNK